eukprot:3657773-Amphidinium_carterae.1
MNYLDRHVRESEDTLELVGQAHRAHLVWYASFVSLREEAVVNPELQHGKWRYCVETGLYHDLPLTAEIEEAREIRKAVPFSASETILKWYHGLPGRGVYPVDCARAESSHKSADATIDEAELLSWSKLLVCYRALQSAMTPADILSTARNRLAERSRVFARWRSELQYVEDSDWTTEFSAYKTAGGQAVDVKGMMDQGVEAAIVALANSNGAQTSTMVEERMIEHDDRNIYSTRAPR